MIRNFLWTCRRNASEAAPTAQTGPAHRTRSRRSSPLLLFCSVTCSQPSHSAGSCTRQLDTEYLRSRLASRPSSTAQRRTARRIDTLVAAVVHHAAHRHRPARQPIPGAAAKVTGGMQAGTAAPTSLPTAPSPRAATAQVTLPYRGTLRVCASTTVKLAADASVPAGEIPGLMIAMDQGAIEASFATGRNSDVVMTPDFRILIGGPGASEVKVRLGQRRRYLRRQLRRRMRPTWWSRASSTAASIACSRASA